MCALVSLPVELLIEIFTQDRLDNADKAVIKRVCKWFNGFKIPIHSYTLKLDHWSLSPWKLARSLMVNPKIGEQLREICVEWYRRQPSKLESIPWTARWDWTLEEIDRIREMNKTWGLSPKNVEAVVAGVNSDALLPLLLCFTPNLITLDMGVAYPRLMHCSDIKSCKPIRKLLGKPLGISEAADEPRWDLVLRNLNRSAGEGVYVPGDSHIWLHEYFVAGQWLPGLANLQNFRARGYDLPTPFNSAHIDVDFVFPAFFFPQIQTIRLECFAVLYPSMRVMGKEKFTGSRSTVKRLEFVNTAFYEKNYITIAGWTGQLAQVDIYKIDGSLVGWPKAVDWLRVKSAFMHNNRATLSKERFKFKKLLDDYYYNIKED
ncbi:hypothetical protein ABW20_dc0107421 [Dactylellina cionopaga]|nr:hypothetical protein ABW20_dc0107421 [Dactylellina cionopaga]